jgi:hypothetical protein
MNNYKVQLGFTLTILILCLSMCDDLISAPRYDTLKRDYKSLINDAIFKVSKGDTISADEIENIIPISQEEFSIFYSYTSPEEGRNFQNSFDKINALIVYYARNNKNNFLKLYSEVSPFVDGEYAESYYEDIDYIIEENKSAFRAIYKKLSLPCRKLLKSYYLKYCK